MSARAGRRAFVWATVAALALGGLALLGGCGGAAGGADAGAAGSAAGDATIAKHRHYDGRMRLGDTWLEVTPVIVNDAKMDLATLCQILRDEEKKAGKADALLCYGPERRAAPAVKTLRVELRKGVFGDVMKALADKTEGAHVVADKTGTLYQILDFALPARRDGALRVDEVRIMAIDERGKAAALTLLEELKPSFPGAVVEIVPVGDTGTGSKP